MVHDDSNHAENERLVTSTPPLRLNLGCGHDVRAGWVNIDVAPLPGVDLVHDLQSSPLPYQDASAEEILCQDVLEHLDVVPSLRELHRLLAPGGRLRIRSPHFTSFVAWADPTHRHAFSVMTFEFFVPGQALEREYYFDFSFSSVSTKISFHKTKGQPWNAIVEKLVNKSAKSQYIYEATALARLFPALNVEAILVK